MTRLLVNAVTQAAHPGGQTAASLTPIFALVAIQFGVFAVNSASTSARGIITELLSTKVMLDLQLQIMDHASHLELEFFENSNSYDILRQAHQDATTRPVSMISTAFGTMQSGITFVSMVGMLARLSPVLAMIALLGPVPAFIADSRYGRHMFRLSTWSLPLQRRMQYLSTLVMTDTAVKEIKLFGLGSYFVDRFRQMSCIYFQRMRRLVSSRNITYTSWSMISTVIGSATYLYVALQAVHGRLTVGDLVLYTAALNGVQTSLQAIFRSMSTLYEDNLYLGTLRSLTAMPRDARRPQQPRSLPRPVRGHVVFDHVTFRYPGAETPALDDVCLEIMPGQTLAIVGRNGSGKSTLVKLLCRLYDPAAGRILLDGIDLRDLDPDDLRTVIGGMFQDYVAYQATAAENVGFGDVRRLDERARVIASARQGGAGPLIEGLPRSYDTPLGKWFDDGVQLSGGEWQRVALSRAFMRDAAILVLDEPTAALDAQAEQELFERLRRLGRDKTTVYISHRFSTVRRADRVLLMAKGRAAEYGTHEELMAGHTTYARLFTMQAAAYLDTGMRESTDGSLAPRTAGRVGG